MHTQRHDGKSAGSEHWSSRRRRELRRRRALQARRSRALWTGFEAAQVGAWNADEHRCEYRALGVREGRVPPYAMQRTGIATYL